jgi:hypothetical protein
MASPSGGVRCEGIIKKGARSGQTCGMLLLAKDSPEDEAPSIVCPRPQCGEHHSILALLRKAIEIGDLTKEAVLATISEPAKEKFKGGKMNQKEIREEERKIDELGRIYLKKEKDKDIPYLGNALRAAKLGASKGVINELIDFAIQKHDLVTAGEAARFIKRKFNEAEIEQLIRWEGSVKEVWKKNKNKTLQERIDAIVEYAIRYIPPGRVMDLIYLGPSERVINLFIKKCFKEGDLLGMECGFGGLPKIAEIRGKEPTLEEIRLLIEEALARD